MNIDLTPLFQAVIAILAALITYKLIPWIKSKTTVEQQTNMLTMVNVLVYAAEQIYGAGNGRKKAEYVEAELARRGFKIDVDAIEAAVKELSLVQKTVAAGEKTEANTVTISNTPTVADTLTDADAAKIVDTVKAIAAKVASASDGDTSE